VYTCARHNQGAVFTGHELSGTDDQSGMHLEPFIHFENADTKRRIHNLLSVAGVLDKVSHIKPRLATIEELQWVHTLEYIEKIKEQSADGGGNAGDYAPFGRSLRFAVPCCIVSGCICTCAYDALRHVNHMRYK
jgi:acetoin utilization deacetylase AcuC-like enzyme